jgi:AcrR family transcriptional regulator
MTKPTTGVQRKGGIPDHDEIMAKIVSCIEELGLGKCTMDDFAHAVGISRISLYRNYGNKTNLVDAVLAFRAWQFNSTVKTQLGELSSLEEAMVLYFSATVRLAKRDKTIRELIDSQYVFHAVYNSENKAMQDHIASLWAPIIRKCCPPNSAIHALDQAAVFNWLLVMQATLTRIAVESNASESEIAFLVKSFVLPAFQIGKLETIAKLGATPT